MKKSSFEGVSNLPPGFRFEPTDEELLFQYLRCKIFSLPLPASIIPDLHSSSLLFDPWDLPGDSMEDKYVFTKNGVSKHKCRNLHYWTMTNSGYWKVIKGSEEHISPPSNLNLLGINGFKTTMAYHFSNNAPTDWIMHEYSLVFSNSNVASKMDDWVICHVFLNKHTMEVHDDDHAIMLLDYNSFSSNTTSSSSCISCSSSSSSSSSVAEVSSSNESDEESS